MPARTVAHPTRCAGFTLVEAVMVIVLIGVLAAVGAPMIANGMRLAITAGTDLDTLSQLRYATERIAREVREVESVAGLYSITTPVNASGSSLSFTKGDGSGTVVTISAAALPSVTVTYSGVGTAPLTTQATGLQFSYASLDGLPVTTSNVRFVDITLTVQNPATSATYSQVTRVALRNAQ